MKPKACITCHAEFEAAGVGEVEAGWGGYWGEYTGEGCWWELLDYGYVTAKVMAVNSGGALHFVRRDYSVIVEKS